jgi:hypothetical protein
MESLAAGVEVFFNSARFPRTPLIGEDLLRFAAPGIREQCNSTMGVVVVLRESFCCPLSFHFLFNCNDLFNSF